MNRSNLMKTLGAAVLLLGLATQLAWAAANPNPRILPVNSVPYGQPYNIWSGQWWQWAYSFPQEANPVGNDPTGALAPLGDMGNLWFLAGSFGTVANRTVTIPPGKGLFFPIANQVWINLPIWGDPEWNEANEVLARKAIAGLIDPIVMSCEIDGVAVKDLASYRVVTPDGAEYMITMPENNVWGLPAGTYGPCVDDGVWLMLPPQAAGKHVIHFTAAQPDGSWALDVTYNLTVGK